MEKEYDLFNFAHVSVGEMDTTVDDLDHLPMFMSNKNKIAVYFGNIAIFGVSFLFQRKNNWYVYIFTSFGYFGVESI